MKDFFELFHQKISELEIPLENQFGYTASETFGNRVDVLKSADFFVRLVQDRSQYSIEFASVSEPENWFDAPVIMKALGIDSEIKSQDSVVLIEAVVTNMGSIGSLFQKFVANKPLLEKIEREKALRMFGESVYK